MNPQSTRQRTRGAMHALILPLLLWASATPLYAIEGDEDQPIYIEADNAELDEEKLMSFYQGNVVMQQGTLRISANEVTVRHKSNRQPEHLIATGNPVTYQQEVEGKEKLLKARAQRMEYAVDKEEITLIDQAVVWQGEDTFKNDRIVFDRAKGQVKAGASAQGKERVKITINPANK